MDKGLLVVPVIFELIHWYAYTRHLDISLQKKMLYTAVDFIHNTIVLAVLFLLLTSAGNMKKVLVLNTLFIIFVIQFFIFKKCSLTLLHNHIIGKDLEHNFVGHTDRLGYLFNGKYPLKKGESSDDWIRWNIWQLVLLVIINMWTLLKT